MSLRHKVSFLALLFSLLFFSPHAVHGRHGSYALRRQHVHRQADSPNIGNGVNDALGNLGLGGNSSPSSQPSTSNTASGSSPAATTPSSSNSVPSQSTSASPQTSNSPAPSSSTPTDPCGAVGVLLGLCTSGTSQPSTSGPSSLPSTSDPASSPPPTSAPTSSPSTSDPASSPPPTSAPTSSPAITSPQSSQTPSSQSTSPTSSCPLGVDLFGQCILPTSSTTSSGSTPASSASANVPSTSQSQTPTSSASSSVTSTAPLLSSIPIPLSFLSTTPSSSPSPSSNNPASSPSPSSNAPASSPPLSSNTPISLPLTSSIPISLPLSSSNPISFPPFTSNTPISSPPPSASSPPVSSTDLPSLSFPPQTTSQPVPSLSDNQSSSPSPAPSSSMPIDPCGPIGLSLGLCTITSGTPISASIPPSGSTPQQTSTLNPSSPILNSQSPFFSTQSSSNPGVSSSSGLPGSLSSTPSSSQSGASSMTGNLSQLASGTITGTVSGSLTTSAPPVISFPSDTTRSDNQTSSVQSTGSFTPMFTPPPNSQFSYVTMSSLLGTSLQSSSIPPTLTNPDAATTTLSLPGPSNSSTDSPTGAPLPAYLPARIYAPDQDLINTLPSDYTICSLLFTSFLSWAFVAQNTQSQGQIFSWAPIIIATALNISTSQTPPYALQVFTPASYEGPSDVNMLLTEYLFYLPSSFVPELANEIKITSSPLYTNIGQPYVSLAKQIDPAFALTSVSNPNAVPGSASGASSHGNKSRTDTIIGVVSALGGLALIILGVLIFNGVKRSRQLRHLRLSDPNLPNDPYPDRSGRDFDQDSVGGPRRRSFYFAEDSLRGGQPQTAEQSAVSLAQAQAQYATQPESQIQYIPRTSPENIRERRAPVVPGAISAPILTQSSLNW